MQTTRSNVPTNEIASFGGCTLWHATPARLSPQTKTCKSSKNRQKDFCFVLSFQARNQQVYWRFLHILTYRVQLSGFVSQLVGQYWSPARASLTVRDSSMISWWRRWFNGVRFSAMRVFVRPRQSFPMMPDIVTKRGHYSSKQDGKNKRKKTRRESQFWLQTFNEVLILFITYRRQQWSGQTK